MSNVLPSVVNAGISAAVGAVVAWAVTDARLGREDRVKRGLAARQALAATVKELRGDLRRYQLQADGPPRRGEDSGFHVEDVNTARSLLAHADEVTGLRGIRARRLVRSLFSVRVLHWADVLVGDDSDFLTMMMAPGKRAQDRYLFDDAYRGPRDGASAVELGRVLHKLQKMG